jgi:hypothetical protein
MYIKICTKFYSETTGKRPVQRRRNRWKDDIKMVFRNVEREGVAWIPFTKDRVSWRLL